MEYIALSKLAYRGQDQYEQAYQDRFNSPYTQHIDIQIGDWPAFFVATPEIYTRMLSIQKTDKKIRELYRSLPGVAIVQFSRRCLIDEIILTNGIEGVHSTRREIDGVLVELEKRDRQRRFAGLVQKYAMLQQNAQFPLKTCRDIRAIYDDLALKEVVEDDPKNAPDGDVFRKGPVDVMNPAQQVIHQGLYPEAKILEAMSRALDYLGNDSVELLYRVCVFHYLLGYIHPFYDGNGRLNRFISSYMLGKELHPLLGYRLSYTIKENINKYYRAYKLCNQAKNRGDLTHFVLMFLEIIEESAQQLWEALHGRWEKLAHYHALIERLPHGHESGFEDLYFVLIQAALFSEQGIPMKELEEGLDRSSTTIRGQLQKIEQAGLLRSVRYGHAKYYGIDLDRADRCGLAP